MRDSNYLLRTMMFVPGHNIRLLESASKSAADSLILDVEDSVRPASNKQMARDCITDFVNSGIFVNYHVFPRINDRESGELLKDASALALPGVSGFVYPKAKCGQDIYFFDKLLETIEYERGYPIGKFKIVPLIETSAAVLNALEICQSSERVIAIAFGCEDFISDLEGIHDREGKSLITARAMIAMAARAAGVTPIDTVHINVHDLEDLEENLKLARILGFEGMLTLHPKEIPLVHQYFSPTSAEIKDAEEMLRLALEAEKMDKGVAVLNGKFIGPPMVAAAVKTIERAKLIKARNNVS